MELRLGIVLHFCSSFWCISLFFFICNFYFTFYKLYCNFLNSIRVQLKLQKTPIKHPYLASICSKDFSMEFQIGKLSEEHQKQNRNTHTHTHTHAHTHTHIHTHAHIHSKKDSQLQKLFKKRIYDIMRYMGYIYIYIYIYDIMGCKTNLKLK